MLNSLETECFIESVWKIFNPTFLTGSSILGKDNCQSSSSLKRLSI
ncbi:MAG: hypothetical protein OJF50_003205 [Nitrospira sp.]|nr:hypothetical protein [Nitrospira sp.]